LPTWNSAKTLELIIFRDEFSACMKADGSIAKEDEVCLFTD